MIKSTWNGLSRDLKMANLGSITINETAFFLCDVQEKFRPAIKYFSDIIVSIVKLVETSKILGIPLVVTEQYPKGLGSTVSELDVTNAIGVYEKTKFSMVIPEIEELLETKLDQAKTIVLFGVEAHVCIEQTAIDLATRGLTVHVVADASSSRSQDDRLLAFERLRQIGCFITTCEAIIFKLIGDKNHEKFGAIRALVKDPSPTTGLTSKI